MTPKQDKTENTGWEKALLLYLHDLICMLMAILLIFLIFFRIIVVSGDSMYSTLVDGDYVLLLNNLLYPEPQQGDIVVISKESFDNGSPIVKRVIATEGQTVDIDEMTATVYVDGISLEETYINTPTTHSGTTQFPLVVEEGCLFVMGDNRGVSLDSRDQRIGQVDRREVLGKAIYLMIPGSNHGMEQPDKTRMGEIE